MKMLFQVVLLRSSVACCNMFLLVDKLSNVMSKEPRFVRLGLL